MVIKKILIILLFLIGVSFLIGKYEAGSKKALETPIPSPQTSESTTSVPSADGIMNLKMTKNILNGSVVYSFIALDNTGKKSFLYQKKATLGESMALPANSWSPNDKYLFIDDKNGYLTDYLVFKANGEPFANGAQYLNATLLFNQKVKNYNLKTMTGWDDPVLISVRTVDGPHFWFDITNQSFIQLVR